MTQAARRLSLLVLFAALWTPSAHAQAPCYPGQFCAQVYIGPAPAPPPVVVYQPAPPPPPVVVYQAPPPPVVVYQAPPPRQIIVQQAPAPLPVQIPPPRPSRIGLHGYIGGLAAEQLHMGGLAGGLRLRKPGSHAALEFGLGVYAGEDYNGLDRAEVPLTVDGMYFLNPEDTFQFYGLAGFGVSFGHAGGFSEQLGSFVRRDYVHLGGQLGAGLEVRIGPHFALNGDIRAFLQHRVDSASEPEFIDLDTGESTDTSAGAMMTLGATFYF